MYFIRCHVGVDGDADDDDDDDVVIVVVVVVVVEFLVKGVLM